MYNGGAFLARAGAQTISSTVYTFEGFQSEFASQHLFSVNITAVSSLTTGVMLLEVADYNTGLWIPSPQEIYLIAKTGTAPSAVVGNTAATTLIVGSKASNISGISALTNITQLLFVAPGLGAKVRLNTSAASGTGTFDVSYTGFRTRPI